MPHFPFAASSPEAFKSIARSVRAFVLGIKPFQCPPELRTNHRPLSGIGEQRIGKALREHYFSYSTYYPDASETYLASQEGESDFSDHLLRRLLNNRNRVIPWIASATGSLKGSRVLEIGCGTGSTTVALAEQGALVTAVDLHEGSLSVARERLAVYGLSANFSCSNATDALRNCESERFDMVAFLAVLEHMTLDERLSALREAWNNLAPGGFLVVDETPNRLWYFDSHTSREHFFMWLPDDLAGLYSFRTPRPTYNKLFGNAGHDAVGFARWGRGVSYHDFALALDCHPADLPVISCKELFIRKQTRSSRTYSHTPWKRYERFLAALRPDIHVGFFLEYLDLILQKPVETPEADNCLARYDQHRSDPDAA
jgi:2-polyprenyl-3-methyl-5-hydroxy-6-metoxy-1,4-benzoquinol methylase